MVLTDLCEKYFDGRDFIGDFITDLARMGGFQGGVRE
jgi:hypothetical protein